jgi:hypothetical protein
MADKRLSVLPFESLIGIDIQCACGTSVGASATSAPELKIKPNCPACGKSIGTAVLAIDALKDFYKHAKAFLGENPANRIAFRVVDDEAPK